ncbi:MAG: metallophosphoesterase [Bacteroidales bacterium]
MIFILLVLVVLLLQLFSVLIAKKIFKDKPALKWFLSGFIVLGLPLFLATMFFAESIPAWGERAFAEVGFTWLILLPFLFIVLLLIFLLGATKILPPKRNSKAFVISLFLLTGLLAYGRYNFYKIKTQGYTLNTKKTTAGNQTSNNSNTRQEVKIIMVSDLHLGTYINKESLARFVDVINEHNPQVLFLVGDIIDRELTPLVQQQMETEFLRLKAPLGKYIVFGNHESYGKATNEQVSDYFTKCGLTVLRDKAVLVDSLFYLVGRNDRGHTKKQRISTDDIIQNDFPNFNNSLPVVVLSHRPHTFEEWESEEPLKYTPSLVLSGHTHNGQLFPFNLIVQKLYPHYYGQFTENGVTYITSSGLGQWGPKFRLGTQSEIVEIDWNMIK